MKLATHMRATCVLTHRLNFLPKRPEAQQNPCLEQTDSTRRRILWPEKSCWTVIRWCSLDRGH